MENWACFPLPSRSCMRVEIFKGTEPSRRARSEIASAGQSRPASYSAERLCFIFLRFTRQPPRQDSRPQFRGLRLSAVMLAEIIVSGSTVTLGNGYQLLGHFFTLSDLIRSFFLCFPSGQSLRQLKLELSPPFLQRPIEEIILRIQPPRFILR